MSLFFALFLFPTIIKAQTTVFINEIHYDNASTDVDEAIEIAGPAGTDLSGWSLVLYNGSSTQLKVYDTTNLSGTIPDMGSGYGVVFVSYPTDGIQNGAPDGMALVDNFSNVIQFLSYEGTFTVIDGPAIGMTSVDIGVAETSSTPVGASLQLSGSGTTYEDFVWNSAMPNTFGIINTGQSFGGDGAPFVLATSPANTDTNIPLDSNIDITFSEDVNITPGWVSIVGSISGAISVSVSGSAAAYTLDPDNDFSAGETVTVTVYAANVTDVDLIDPPDNMMADYIFEFTAILPVSDWVINEFLADPATDITGDANGDGTRDSSQDEFVEIVNNTGDAVDISGWTLSDAVSVRHTFPLGTVVPDEAAIVVFGGGTPTGDFGWSIVQTASAGQLGLNNAGDQITLSDGVSIISTVSYGSEGGDDQSLTRDPDVTGSFVKHSTATNSAGALFSPGTLIDGSLFPGTILEPVVKEIYEIQGEGLYTYFANQKLTTKNNVVTALTSDGFFIQTPTERSDNNISTSDGIYVFTYSAPTVAVGDLVDVTGKVVEYYEFTEISNAEVTVTGTGILPDPVVFDENMPSPLQPQSEIEFERFEGMLVSITGGTVTGSNQYFGSDPVAEVFIVAAPQRTYREPGVEYPGAGVPGIPVFDNNPEVFELDPNKLGLSNIMIPAGSSFDAVGVLGYEYSGYELWPSSLTVNEATLPQPVRAMNPGEATIGSLNCYRLFDDVNDGGETVVSAAEYALRLEKFSMYIREVLNAPYIIGVQEVEKLGVLVDLANKIATDDPSVVYTAYLEEGNDVGGIDVGFLVREDYVRVDAITQLGATETYTNPTTGEEDILNDRPPLLLEGSFLSNSVPVYPISVMVVHQRSLSGIETLRVQTKRLAQAQSVAEKVQVMQTANPDIHLVIVGDYNAYEFTDGYVDVVGQMKGDFVPEENLLSGDDLVDPNLTDQVLNLPAADRYSYIYNGTAQVLDHALTSVAVNPAVTGFAYGRGNCDAAEDLIHSDSNPLYSSDHDGLVLFLDVTPPEIVLNDAVTLWPPNHKYQCFNVEDIVASVSEVALESVYVVKVTSDEPEDGEDDGNTLNDMVITDYQTVNLRAERQGCVNGRVYTIYLAAQDAAGNIGTAEYKVSVPVGKKQTAVDDGIVYEVYSEFEVPEVTAQQLAKTGVEAETENSLPETFSLAQNYPNPFNPVTTIRYALPENSHVSIKVYDMLGREVTELVNSIKSSGYHEVKFDGSNLSSGVYIYLMETSPSTSSGQGFREIKKLVLMK